MKKTRLIAAAIILVLACGLLAACAGGNGGSDSGKGDTIVGSWVSQDYGGAYIYTFNEDGSGNYDAAGTQMPFTYTAEDGKLSIMYDGSTVPFETEYSITVNTLNVKDSTGADTLYNRK